MRVKYLSNNSGGDWWLRDEDWLKLEKNGWTVEWVRNAPKYRARDADKIRWLGALATSAYIDVESVNVAIAKWEHALGMDPYAIGCRCCGQPHSFYKEDD